MFPAANIPADDWSQLKSVGYWWSENEPELPHPKQFVDLQWSETERAKVVRYLSDSYSMPYILMGPSWCRFECGVNDMGCLDLTDGTWIYPEGFAHYVDKHSVKPTEEFLNHLRAIDFRMPRIPMLDE
ncbi:hypothetical protein OT109_06675 [Phycisphaeraceae bacterium D3-23]